MTALPCNFVLTGHLKPVHGEEGGIDKYVVHTTGNLAVSVPAEFSEMWVMDPKKRGSDVNYRILTRSTGVRTARSRLAADGLLETYEDPDMKAILKKAGLPIEDKPF
jgi:hypothetical protein